LAGALVLVVDDDDDLRTMIADALMRTYSVVTARNGREALVAIHTKGPFDLILSDLAMPELGGVELYWHLVQLVPDLARRLVFMSAGEVPVCTRPLIDHVPLIAKPFEVRDLRALVAKLIAESS
jgi:CheY-like chemotaxis protein